MTSRYDLNPVACSETCGAARAGHPEQGNHHSLDCLNYRNPPFPDWPGELAPYDRPNPHPDGT
jgi:hypothetical protein